MTTPLPDIETLIATANVSPPAVASTLPAAPDTEPSPTSKPPTVDEVLGAILSRFPSAAPIFGERDSDKWRDGVGTLEYLLSGEDALSSTSRLLAAGAVELWRRDRMALIGEQFTRLPAPLQRAVTRALRRNAITHDTGRLERGLSKHSFAGTAIANMVFTGDDTFLKLAKNIETLADAEERGIVDDEVAKRVSVAFGFDGDILSPGNAVHREVELLSWLARIGEYIDPTTGEESDEVAVFDGRPNGWLLKVAMLAIHSIIPEDVGRFKPWIPGVGAIVGDEALYWLRRIVAGEFMIRHPAAHIQMAGFVRSNASILGLYKMASIASRREFPVDETVETISFAKLNSIAHGHAPAWADQVAVREIASPTQDVPGSYAYAMASPHGGWVRETRVQDLAARGAVRVLHASGLLETWPREVVNELLEALRAGVASGDRTSLTHAPDGTKAILPEDLSKEDAAAYARRFRVVLAIAAMTNGHDPAIFV